MNDQDYKRLEERIEWLESWIGMKGIWIAITILILCILFGAKRP